LNTLATVEETPIWCGPKSGEQPSILGSRLILAIEDMAEELLLELRPAVGRDFLRPLEAVVQTAAPGEVDEAGRPAPK
jgi:hypothetical protein